jgi:FKBP-type peptidyl-prolyl cis-trans isomerase SlyD
MQISKNKVVSLAYELRIESTEGELIEKVESSKPLIYIHGMGNMLESFEDNLKDLSVGDIFQFMIPFANGYGDVSQDAIVELPRSIFSEGEKEDEALLTPGNYVPMQDNEGNMLEGHVIEATDELVVMDFNHPLAGEDLYFSGEITEVREATPEEIGCGHVHNGEHHHHDHDHGCSSCSHQH